MDHEKLTWAQQLLTCLPVAAVCIMINILIINKNTRVNIWHELGDPFKGVINRLFHHKHN